MTESQGRSDKIQNFSGLTDAISFLSKPAILGSLESHVKPLIG
jgi:hypothetical protein